MPPQRLEAVLRKMRPAHVAALYRIVKNPKAGLAPFFTHPRQVILLRQIAPKTERK